MKELVWFIERLGEELNWSTRYMDLAATTAGAVFRSLDLDESSDAIPIGEHVAAAQLKTLESDLLGRGLSPSTITTYTTTWKRLSSVADGWVKAAGTSSEKTFWDDIDQYRDSRPSRRSRTVDTSAPSDEMRYESGPLEDSGDADGPWKRIEIPLDGGVAVVVLPRKLSQTEAFLIMEAVINAGAVDR
jgi:hypothetical protein